MLGKLNVFGELVFVQLLTEYTFWASSTFKHLTVVCPRRVVVRGGGGTTTAVKPVVNKYGRIMACPEINPPAEPGCTDAFRIYLSYVIYVDEIRIRIRYIACSIFSRHFTNSMVRLCSLTIIVYVSTVKTQQSVH